MVTSSEVWDLVFQLWPRRGSRVGKLASRRSLMVWAFKAKENLK